MASVSYTSLQSQALSLIKDLGSKAAVTGSDGTGFSTYGAFLKVERKDDSSAYASDSRVLLIPGSIKYVPQVGDTVTVKGQAYYVHEVEEENPAGVCLYYKLTVIA